MILHDESLWPIFTHSIQWCVTNSVINCSVQAEQAQNLSIPAFSLLRQYWCWCHFWFVVVCPELVGSRIINVEIDRSLENLCRWPVTPVWRTGDVKHISFLIQYAIILTLSKVKTGNSNLDFYCGGLQRQQYEDHFDASARYVFLFL